MDGPTPARLARLRAVAAGRTRRLVLVLDDVHKSRNLGALLRTCDALGLQEVHATTEGTFELLVGRDGIRLVMGKGPYRPKIERAARVLAETARRKGQPLVIFLDNEAHPERVVARLK